jgi:hypothetical protein
MNNKTIKKYDPENKKMEIKQKKKPNQTNKQKNRVHCPLWGRGQSGHDSERLLIKLDTTVGSLALSSS